MKVEIHTLNLIFFATGVLGLSSLCSGNSVPETLNPPKEQGLWIRPGDAPAEPMIGHKNGLRISIYPIHGDPRGVIRVHAPYVNPGRHAVINFIAIEPIVHGNRGFSELERSKLDEQNGLRMWFSDSPNPEPKMPWQPARGRTGRILVNGKTVETLSLFLHVERFENGAHPYVKVVFRADRPNEVGFRVYAHKDSAPMESCVLTATMGNYSRCRLLWLKDEVVDSRKLWPGYKGNDFVFTEDFPAERIYREKDGTYIAAITPNESDLSAVTMPPGGWTFNGKVSTQYWRRYSESPRSDLRVRVNGRATYYCTTVLIPGGVAFENFEFIEGFQPGTELWFGVTLKTPHELGWRLPSPD